MVYKLRKMVYHCYKLEKGGKLTVFLSVTNNRNKKSVNYDSTLYLTKIADMTEV